MIDGTGHVDSEKNESIAQTCSNESALHVQKNLIWGLLLFWEKQKNTNPPQKNLNISNFAAGLVWRPMLSYPIVFEPWVDSCNVPLFM